MPLSKFHNIERDDRKIINKYRVFFGFKIYVNTENKIIAGNIILIGLY
tara:strand:+ start:547 stop:690 length:144 start_codon:yes stop_codon:yes gene_type:complete